MSRAIQEERQAEKLKKLLSFAQTLVFKDEEKAYSFETPLSIELSNYYISARTEDLPYLTAFDKKGFPSSLNDYNLIPNGIQYFIESYELNSKYVGSDEYRYKQVRESTYLTNMNQVDPAYKGNIFELNAYYRSLYNDLNVDILKARTTKNYGILYYDSAYAEGIDIERFNNIYIETRSWFTHALENRAMQWDPNHRIFNLWMIVIFTVFAYLDEELEKAFNYDLFNQYDIRNMLYSFGITFLNFLPQDFQLRVLKNLKPLLRAKGTDKIFDIVIKDIFGYNAVQVYKYYLVRSNSIDDQVITEYKQGLTSLKEVLDSSSYESLYFIRVPYDVNNISQYLAENTIKTEDKISFSDVTLNDPYWSNSITEDIILASFANSPYIIESKYLDIGNSSSFIPDIAGITLIFSMIHDTSHSIPLSFHPFGDGSLDMFGHFIITFYAILRKNLPNSGSISTPPSAYINATDIIGRVFSVLNSQDKLNDHFGTGNKYQSLTLKDLERRGIHLYLATNEGYINESRLETIETEDTIYNGLGQKFKSNFETLKALYKALRYVAYSNQEIIGIGPKAKDFTTPGYLIGRLKPEINSSLFNTLNEDDPDYSKALAGILSDNGYTISKDHNTPGIRNLIERANLILNEEALFEARTELGNKYGEAFGDLDAYLATVYPITYKKVNDAFTSGNEQDILAVINELYSTLNLSLREIIVRVPENTGVESNLSEDVNFKTTLKEYVLPYAIRLLEYFMSYTVQIRNSGTVNDVTNDGAETIQVLDMLDTQSSRSNVVMDYIFTGKNCNPDEWPENGTDLDRHGLNKDSVTYEPLLDEAMGVVRVLANTVSQPSNTYELNASEAVYPDLVSSNPDLSGYGRHGESITFKESLYAYVRNATDLTEANSIDTHDMVAVIGGPVLVSGKPSGHYPPVYDDWNENIRGTNSISVEVQRSGIWDGTRDYSFVDPESDTLEIWTPEQFAGLMAMSYNQAQYDYRPDLSVISLQDKTVVLKADLYFNKDCEKNYKDWVWSDSYYGMNTARNCSANNLAYQTFLDGSVRNMRLNVSRFKFDGGFHKLVGLFKDMYDGADKMSYLVFVSGGHSPLAGISNLTFEYCVVKNGFSDYASYDVGACIMEVAAGPVVEAGKFRNLSANHCIVCAGCRSNSNWNRSLLIRAESANDNERRFDGMNINVRNSFLYGYDNTAYSSWRTAGIVVAGNGIRRLDLAYSFNTYVKQDSASVIDKRSPNTVTNPKLFAYGNTGEIETSYEPASQVISSSKEDLIEAVNADILTRATGELSLIDENGDFTGVCP